MKVFVTTSVYALGRELGMEAAVAEVHRQLADPGFESLECVRVIHRLRHLVDVELRVDPGATCIGKARSRAFDAAWRSECDAWVTVDDDVDADSSTLAAMLEALDDLAPRIVLVPCLLRRQEGGPAIANVQMPTVVVDRRLPSGAVLRQVTGGGFGLVGMNRAALNRIVDFYGDDPSIAYVDDDGVKRRALFHDLLALDDRGQQRWLGEDLSFFRRVPSPVSIEALLAGVSVHSGQPLRLESLA